MVRTIYIYCASIVAVHPIRREREDWVCMDRAIPIPEVIPLRSSRAAEWLRVLEAVAREQRVLGVV